MVAARRANSLSVFHCTIRGCASSPANSAAGMIAAAVQASKDAIDAVKDVEGIMRDAVKLKFLDKPLTAAQLTELIQIPPRK